MASSFKFQPYLGYYRLFDAEGKRSSGEALIDDDDSCSKEKKVEVVRMYSVNKGQIFC